MKAQAHTANGSEVAALRQALEREYEAPWFGLCGLTQGTARHAWITARMGRLASAHMRLCEVVGTEAATAILVVVEKQQVADAERKAEMNHETGRTPPGTD